MQVKPVFDGIVVFVYQLFQYKVQCIHISISDIWYYFRQLCQKPIKAHLVQHLV